MSIASTSVRGVGGHGAYPHTTSDPIVLASRIVTALQTLVSREIDPLDPAVVTVGSFQAGTKHNIISDEARLQLTVRSYTPEVRKLLLDGIARIARGEAIAAGVPEDRMPVVTVREEESTPATVNTELTARTLALFRAISAPSGCRRLPPVMGGEDFGRFLADESIESLIFWVGGVPQARWDAADGDTAEAALAAQPLLGARRGAGDRDRDRGDDGGGAGGAEEGVAHRIGRSQLMARTTGRKELKQPGQTSLRRP